MGTTSRCHLSRPLLSPPLSSPPPLGKPGVLCVTRNLTCCLEAMPFIFRGSGVFFKQVPCCSSSGYYDFFLSKFKTGSLSEYESSKNNISVLKPAYKFFRGLNGRLLEMPPLLGDDCVFTEFGDVKEERFPEINFMGSPSGVRILPSLLIVAGGGMFLVPSLPKEDLLPIPLGRSGGIMSLYRGRESKLLV